jgi:prepilin-type N-terminal cleavage/methylation domain-containing protein
MKRALRRLSTRGFTIIELMIVVVIIGILATVVLVAYNGIQNSTRDKSVLSDVDALDGIETRYGLQNGVAGKAWYSGSGVDSDLDFTPSKDNVIDIVINSTDYCIRAYNPTAATYKSIETAATKESSDGVCTSLDASATAISDSP